MNVAASIADIADAPFVLGLELASELHAKSGLDGTSVVDPQARVRTLVPPCLPDQNCCVAVISQAHKAGTRCPSRAERSQERCSNGSTHRRLLAPAPARPDSRHATARRYACVLPATVIATWSPTSDATAMASWVKARARSFSVSRSSIPTSAESASESAESVPVSRATRDRVFHERARAVGRPTICSVAA